jgi:hypothetical protein
MQRPPLLLEQLPLQQSVLVVQCPPIPRQHVPTLEPGGIGQKTSSPNRGQHCVLSVQESPGCAHGGPQVRAPGLPAQLLLQQEASPSQRSPIDPQHLPATLSPQLPLQHSSSAKQELRFVRHVPQVPMNSPNILQKLLQHSLSAMQLAPVDVHATQVQLEGSNL